MRELDKVIGYEDIKNELYRIIDIIQNPDKYKSLGVSNPKGIMFAGAPGIGKTLMAKCFIRECGRKDFVIRKDRSDGDFVDHIRETFKKAAEEEPSIILLDDLDKFANEDQMHRDAEEYVTVQTCIDEFKEKDLFVVATCNDFRFLPESLTRRGRFDKTYHMRFPTNEDAKKIISYYLKDKVLADDIDVDEIVRLSEGHSCADLETVVNEAGIFSAYDNKKSISQEDIRKACLRTFWNYKEIGADCPAETISRRAVHEAGHAFMCEYFYPGEVNLLTIEVKNRWGEAMVLRKRNEYRLGDFRNNEIEIMINLAGKAASEVILGEIDMGACSDLEHAYDRTDNLLDDIAAYDFLSHKDSEYSSETVYNHLGVSKGTEMARYYFKTKQIIIQNRAFLDALIEQVIEKKTLTYKDIAPIREKYSSDFANEEQRRGYMAAAKYVSKYANAMRILGNDQPSK